MPFEDLVKVRIKKHKDEILYERGNEFVSIMADPEVGAGSIKSNLMADDSEEDMLFNAAIGGMEQLLLTMACAGVNMEDQKIAEAVFAAADGIDNNT